MTVLQNDAAKAQNLYQMIVQCMNIISAVVDSDKVKQYKIIEILLQNIQASFPKCPFLAQLGTTCHDKPVFNLYFHLICIN